MDEKAQRRLVFINRPDELSGLLRHPCTGGMSGTAREVDAARAKLDEEEDVQRLQKQSVHGEEVTSDELLFIMGHELSPTERRTTLTQGWYAVTSEDAGDGLIADLDAQFAQFSLDLAVAPVIGTGKLQHQTLHFDIGSWSSAGYTMSVGPFPPRQFTMPLEDGLGLEDADHVA